jgi:predicted small metal-binding protein
VRFVSEIGAKAGLWKPFRKTCALWLTPPSPGSSVASLELTDKECAMTKVLKCGDLNPGCAYEARGRDENEVLQKAAQHAKTEHGLETIPQEMMSQVRNAIHDEDSRS